MIDEDNLNNFLKKIKEKEKSEKPYSIFVEIGPGSLAIPTNKLFKEHEIYIGIDTDYQALKISKDLSDFFAKRKKEIGKINEKNIFFLRGSAEKLPFEDNFVDEIFIGNVIGYSRISLKVKDKILKEIERVLKENGLLIIKETLTPFNFDELINYFKEKDINFELEKVVNYRNENFKKELLKYEPEKFMISGINGYIAYFRKRKNNN